VGMLTQCLEHLKGDRVFAVTVTEAEQTHGRGRRMGE
jgi:hypothetical protein